MKKLYFLCLVLFSFYITQSHAFIEEEEYFNLYTKVVNKDEKHTTSPGWQMEKREGQHSAIFKTLEITTPKDQMIKWGQKFQALVNRKPKHSTLIIGCGNIPPARHDMKPVYYIDNFRGPGDVYRQKHRHSNADTWDPDFARNPTIINAFGSTMIDDSLFEGHRYKEIVIEGIELNSLPYAKEMIQFLLAKNGVVIEKGSYDAAYVYSSFEDYSSYSQPYVITREGSNAEKIFESNNEPSLLLPECASIEEFMGKYDVKREAILKALNYGEQEFQESSKSDGWANIEYYWLPYDFKEELYKKRILNFL